MWGRLGPGLLHCLPSVSGAGLGWRRHGSAWTGTRPFSAQGQQGSRRQPWPSRFALPTTSPGHGVGLSGAAPTLCRHTGPGDCRLCVCPDAGLQVWTDRRTQWLRPVSVGCWLAVLLFETKSVVTDRALIFFFHDDDIFNHLNRCIVTLCAAFVPVELLSSWVKGHGHL